MVREMVWMIGPEMRIVTIVQAPNVPPRATPLAASRMSSVIRTFFTGQCFLLASENVKASYDPLPKSADAYSPVPAAKTAAVLICLELFTDTVVSGGLIF